MNGRASTTAGVGTADGSGTVDHRERLQRIASYLEYAQEVLAHKETHEVRICREILHQAQEEIGIIEAQTARQGQQGGQSIHGEDPKTPQVT